jgi:DNA polymerase elongation subunit (family B)
MKQVFFIGDMVINQHHEVFIITEITVDDGFIYYAASSTGAYQASDLSIFLEKKDIIDSKHYENNQMVELLKREVESLRNEVCRLLSNTR